MQGPARRAQALYILGDLFEYWLGDDDLDAPFNSDITQAIAQVAESGVAVYLMVGNRDFLLGPEFAHAAKLTLLPDPTLTPLAGTPTLLMHGDSLCTDDLKYQAVRQQLRTPAAQAALLAKPLAERRAIADEFRRQSEQAKSEKTANIMDATEAAVAAQLRAFGLPRLIHGHTHRPAQHCHRIAQQSCERWVLPDWQEGQGAVWLECGPLGCFFRSLAL